LVFLLLVAASLLAAAPAGAASGAGETRGGASSSARSFESPSKKDKGTKNYCRKLNGKSRARCRAAIRKCNKLKGKRKRAKCRVRARRIGKKRPVAGPLPAPPQPTLNVLRRLPPPQECYEPLQFDPANFPSTALVKNRYLPLLPGTKIIMEGRANRGGGPLPHRVTFTATDLVKKINGVSSQVMWDVDVNQGEVVESELAFFAQDRDGNVWNTGEYPEEYDNGVFTGAPSTWIAGQEGAKAGIHMFAQPSLTPAGAPWYSQGVAPSVEFFDCAAVKEMNQSTCVPFRCWNNNVLITHETSPIDVLSGVQTKYHAPYYGIVQVGALNDPEGETLVLVNHYKLSAAGLERARNAALKLEERAYKVNEAYATTPPARRR
jgi:hypothetical protein